MKPAYTAVSVLTKKRDGGVLSAAELRWLIEAFVQGVVADYQMSAFAMAVLLQGMNEQETAALTLAMRDSGRTANLRGARGPKLDKHSTGGVGDKVSICLAPLVAACGGCVPMISGRGLGHTGGTLDKLEAIPGFSVDQSISRFERLVKAHGFALIGQTLDLAPADRKLYALRDVTATVESIPLITASILSKKLAEDLDGLVLDVKVGRGAFMKTLADGRLLARSIVKVGQAAGTKVSALLTRMDAPLGRCVGNALETAEAFEVLHGAGPDDLVECTLALGAEMLRLGKLARTEAAARRMLHEAIRSGRAARKLEALIAAQGGDRRVVSEPDRLPQAKHRAALHATRAGYVHALDAMAIAEAALRLGAGRTRADQAIDPSVGIELLRKPGDAVKRGELIARVHAGTPSAARREAAGVLGAYRFAARRPRLAPLVIERISS
ncbi:MAG TPA: thymidine phosphorylase [Polyangiales bacterium]